MCGRYSITSAPEAMRRLFKFTNALPNLRPRYNVAPTQDVPVVRSASDARELVTIRWGIVPHWARDLSIGSKMINARSETVAEKPSFRESFKKRRCLVVADGYYEWQKVDGKKLPWRYTLADGSPFAFAGLWARWDKASDGVPVETCTIITTEANQLARHIHDRMPVILAPDDYAAWLGENSVREVSELLKPYPAEDMRAYRVSTVVSNSRNDVPECIEPAA